MFILALDGFYMQVANIQNDYLYTDKSEKVWLMSGPELGVFDGMYFIINKLICGLNYLGSSFRWFVARKLDFTCFVSDTDFWRRPEEKPECAVYYEYVMINVDDIIAVSMDSVGILE